MKAQHTGPVTMMVFVIRDRKHYKPQYPFDSFIHLYLNIKKIV